MKKRVSLLLLICLSLLLLTPVSLSAQDGNAASTKVIRVGFPNQSGVSEVNEDGTFSGYTYDYLERLCQFTGWKIQYVTVQGDDDTQLSKMLDMLQSGEIDLLGCMVKNEELESLYAYPQSSYGMSYTTLSTLESNVELNESNFARYARENGIRIAAYRKGTIRNNSTSDYCKVNGYQYQFVYCDNEEEILSKLESGEADVSVGVNIGRLSKTKIVASYAGTPFYFAANKNHTEFVQELESGIQQLEQANPYLEQILSEKNFSETQTEFVLSQEEKAYVDSLDSLNVAICADAPPFQYFNDQGEAKGVSVSLLNEICEDLGVQVNYVNSPDKADILLGTTYSYEQAVQKGLILSLPYMESDVTVVFQKGIQYNELDGKLLALPEGAEKISRFSSSQVTYYDTLQECIEAVEKGNADYCYANSYSVSYYISEKTYLHVNQMELPGEKKEIRMGVSRDQNPKLLILLNRAIEAMDDGLLHGYLTEEMSNNLREVGVLNFMKGHPAMTGLVLFAITLLILAWIIWSIRFRQKQKAEAMVNGSRAEFMSRMSHDMRTPMNAIIGMSTLGADCQNLEESKEYHQKVFESGRYLLGLINDTLDLNRMDSSGLRIEYQTESFQKLLLSLKDIFQQKAEENQVRLLFTDMDISDRYARMDPLRMQQIFVNLINNAIKFTPSGGQVEIRMECLGENNGKLRMRFQVKDSGCGMSREFQKKMYQPFEQEGRVSKESDPGTGLGLSIVEKLVKCMGGTIECSSAPGKGTCFTIQMKMDVAEAPTQDITPENQAFPDHIDQLADCRILVAEDQKLNMEIVTKLLEKEKAQVLGAANGKEAVELFQNHPEFYFDAVLMDIRMPVMDGLEAARQIRELERPDAKSVPIIAMTANAYDDDKKRSREAGIDVHLTKPVEPKEMYKTILSYINQKQ